MTSHDPCTNCQTSIIHWVHDNCFRICSQCGNSIIDNVTKIVSDEEFYKSYCPKYKEMPYMRSLNFRKLMRQTLGRQRVIIPRKLMDEIRQEIIYIDIEEVRRVLRSKELQKKYYKHAGLIVMILEGKDVKLPEWIERALECMYSQYEENYDEVKLNKKKMIPFNYVNRRGLWLIENKYEIDLKQYYYLFPDVKQRRTRVRNETVFQKLIAREGRQPLRY